MTFGVALQMATFAAALSAFTAAASGGNLNPLFLVGWLVGLAMAWVTPEGRFKASAVLAAGLVAAPVLGAAIVSFGLDPIIAAVYFASILLLARLFARKGVEGHGQVHLLSILVLAGGAAISPDITYIVIFVVYLFVVTFALLLAHLRRETGDAHLALPLREVAGAGLLGSTALLALFALGFTVALFVVFPRATFGIGIGRTGGSTHVGLSDRIELAGFGRLKENERVVLRVRGPEPSGPDDTLDVYWRAQPLEVFDGSGWRAGEREIDVHATPVVDFSRDKSPGVFWTLEVEVVGHLGVSVLPVPDTAVSLRMSSVDGRGRRISLRLTESREVRTVGIPAPPYEYAVDLDPFGRTVDETPPGPEHLELPDLHPAVVALAARLAEEARGNLSLLPERLERWLSGSFKYSADLPRDPSLEHFLFERREGHCEYFATAMVVMLRLQGVPSRVVVGYHGGRWNTSGGYFGVRQSDAHAWVEAWHQERGWLRYEPTPPAGIGRGSAPATLKEQLADVWDSLQAAWTRHVLTFDRTSQRDIVRSMTRAVRDLGRAFDRSPVDGIGGLRRFGFAGAVLLFAAVSFVLFRHFSRRFGRGLSMSADAERARRVYRAFLKAIGEAGLERKQNQTAEEMLEEVRRALSKADDGGAIERAERIVGRYGGSRFGGRPMSVEEARHLEADASHVGQGLKRTRMRNAV